MDPKQTELNRRSSTTPSGDGNSSEEIRRQIERRRADMDVVASTLARRLDPHQLADDVASAVKRKLASRGERIRMALYDSVKENPLPWLLVGGGLGWLVVRGRTTKGSHETALQLRSDYDPPGAEGYRYGVSGRYSEPSGLEGNDEGIVERAKEKASALTHKVGDATSHAREKVAETLSEATDTTKEKIRSAVDSTREKASDAMDTMNEKVGEMREQVMSKGSQWLDESPLLLCGVALGVGILAALAVPTTPVEDRLMGEQRDRLLASARGKGQELVDRGKEMVGKATRVADAAMGSASREVSRMGNDGNLQQGATDVVRTAAETAKREAQRQGLIGGSSSPGASPGPSSSSATSATSRGSSPSAQGSTRSS